MILKEIKNKIASTKRISQVAKALELVSATKMKKAQKIAFDSRPFAKKAIRILNRLTAAQIEDMEETSFYFKPRESEKILVAVLSSDKGFCGAFNNNILKFTEKEIRQIQKVEKGAIEVMAIGKKAINYFKKRDYTVSVEFVGIGDFGKFEEVKPIADLFIRYFKECRYKKIYLFYTDFISSFIQVPKRVQVLPLVAGELKEMLDRPALSFKKNAFEEAEDSGQNRLDYIFEPSVLYVFNSLVPVLVEFEIYHAILEANAAEHSARMIAMKNASNNAYDVIADLTLEYNKARQNQITAELSEISSAKEVLQ